MELFAALSEAEAREWVHLIRQECAKD